MTSRTLRTPLIGLAFLLGTLGLSGCESVGGSLTLDGETFAVVECRRLDDPRAVALETDGGFEVLIADLGFEFLVGLGTGDCIRTEVQMGTCTMGTMGGPDECEPDTVVCVERDFVDFAACTNTRIDVSESGVERQGEPAVNVEATIDCRAGDRSLVGQVDASNCT